MQTLPYPPFYGAATADSAGPGAVTPHSRNVQGQQPLRVDLPRAPAADRVTAFSGLGATQNGTTALFLGASWLGAALGGALVGYIASGKQQGALLGGAFTSGLAGVSDAVMLWSQRRRPVASVAGLVGLGALSWSLYRVNRRRR